MHKMRARVAWHRWSEGVAPEPTFQQAGEPGSGADQAASGRGWLLTHPDLLPEDDQLRLKTALAHCPEREALARHIRSFAGSSPSAKASEPKSGSPPCALMTWPSCTPSPTVWNERHFDAVVGFELLGKRVLLA